MAAGPLWELKLHPSQPAATSLPGLTVETGGPETEINCQVSGAGLGGGCQSLCFLAGGGVVVSRACPKLSPQYAISPHPNDTGARI